MILRKKFPAVNYSEVWVNLDFVIWTEKPEGNDSIVSQPKCLAGPPRIGGGKEAKPHRKTATLLKLPVYLHQPIHASPAINPTPETYVGSVAQTATCGHITPRDAPGSPVITRNPHLLNSPQQQQHNPQHHQLHNNTPQAISTLSCHHQQTQQRNHPHHSTPLPTLS